jgi:apolipoprotein N-acyltransferase
MNRDIGAGAIVGSFLGLVLFGVFFSFLMAYPAMLLWNSCLVPAVSGIHNISWLQSWGIMSLCSFLFKSSK